MKLTSAGCAGNLQRVEALRNQFDYSGDVEVVPQRVVESLQQRGVLRIGGRGLEIGNGQANFFHTQAVPVFTQSCACASREQQAASKDQSKGIEPNAA